MRTYLCGQTYALALSAAERDARAGKRQVFQTYVQKEAQACAEFLQYLGRYLTLVVVEVPVQGHEPFVEFAQIHLCQLGNVLAGNEEVQGLLSEALAVTFGTLCCTVELVGPLLCRCAHVRVQHLSDVLHEAVVIGEIVARGACHGGRYAETLWTAVQYLVHGLARQLPYGGVQCGVVPFQHCLNLPEYHGLACLAQRGYATLADAQFRVGEYLLLVNEGHHAKTLASGAGTLRGVERKVVRSRVAVCYAAGGAHEAAAIMAHLARFHVEDHDESPALLHGGGNALAQTVAILFSNTQTVHHHLYVVVLVAVQLHVGQEFLHLPVNASIEVAFLAHALQKFAVVSLAVLHHGGKDVDTPSLVPLQQEGNNLFLGVADHLLSAHIGIGLAHTGIEQAEEVVNLGGGAHGGAWIAVGGLLLYADNGRETADLVHIGARHASEEVACVGREGFYVSALTLGIYGIEGKTGLTRPAQSRYHGERAAWYLHVHVLQVVFPGAFNYDFGV